MKKLLPLFLLIFAAASFGQTRGLQVKYDKFKDETTAIYVRLNVAKDLSMIITADYPGEKLAKDQEQFVLSFGCRSVCFNTSISTNLITLVDGERITFSQPSDRESMDLAMFYLTRAQLTKLANAKLVEFQVGRHEGVFLDPDHENIKKMLEATKAAAK
jgi:uncharacterized protein YuzB (UPF0349 family)